MTTTPERLTQDESIDALSRYGYGWSDTDTAGASAQRGLSEAVVRDISAKKDEPAWMARVYKRLGVTPIRMEPFEGHPGEKRKAQADAGERNAIL